MITQLTVLSIFAVAVFACPPIELPEFSSMNCTWARPGLKRCTFECLSGGDLIGASVLTCRKGADEWNKRIPICYPDFSKCGKGIGKKCPKLSSEYINKFEQYSRDLPSEEQEAIQNIRNAYRAGKLTRSNAKPCYSWMCKVKKCAYLAPNKSLVNRCIRCKKTKQIKCGRSGSLFG